MVWGEAGFRVALKAVSHVWGRGLVPPGRGRVGGARETPCRGHSRRHGQLSSAGRGREATNQPEVPRSLVGALLASASGSEARPPWAACRRSTDPERGQSVSVR